MRLFDLGSGDLNSGLSEASRLCGDSIEADKESDEQTAKATIEKILNPAPSLYPSTCRKGNLKVARVASGTHYLPPVLPGYPTRAFQTPGWVVYMGTPGSVL
mgnify:CR=1 FL=1